MYTAEDYINFIEMDRRDKISPHALAVIAKSYRNLQKALEEYSTHDDSCPVVVSDSTGLYVDKCTCGLLSMLKKIGRRSND